VLCPSKVVRAMSVDLFRLQVAKAFKKVALSD
jgi:hypothetical protein